jgi:hypothetical protein
MRPKFAQAKGREQCLTALKVMALTRPCDAQSVMAGLVSSGITRGERRCAPGSASIASECAAKVTQLDGLAANRLRPVARGPREGVMTLQISQRG